MTMRAQIERIAAAPADPWGGNDEPVWQPSGNPVPCYLWSLVEREILDTRKEAVVEDLRMMVPTTTDVGERDRINGVTNRLGAAIRAGIFDIVSVVRRKDHLELVLRGVQA